MMQIWALTINKVDIRTSFNHLRRWYKHEAKSLPESLLSEHPAPPAMRVFVVCLLSAVALCKGNQLNWVKVKLTIRPGLARTVLFFLVLSGVAKMSGV
jgi:hypothetical protein